MAGRSKYSHLKSRIFCCFSEGLTPADILQMDSYKEVPQSTIYDWSKEYRERMQQNIVEAETLDITPVRPIPESIPDYSEITDYEATRRCFRSIIDDETCSPASRVSAGMGMLKLLCIGQELPLAMIGGEEEQTAENSGIDDNITPEERMRRIKDRLARGKGKK